MYMEIGIVVGFFEFLNNEGIGQIQWGRINLAKYILQSFSGSAGGITLAWLVYSSLALLATTFASYLVVYKAPQAKGAGRRMQSIS